MKNLNILLGFVILTSVAACSDFLDVNPTGVLAEDVIAEPTNVDGFVTTAYSVLGNDHFQRPHSLWPYGNIRSDDAYKGGSGESDLIEYHYYEISEGITSRFGQADEIWYRMYVGISRANNAIRALEAISEDEYPLKEERIGEMRFLRGFFYFKLKILFNRIPFFDEDIPIESYDRVSNTVYTSDELWDIIAGDFRTAVDLLPQKRTDAGRVDKSAANAYLAKTLLYSAYEQDENYNVININHNKLEEVILACNQVEGNLEEDIANNFLPGPYENGVESIFAIQFSHDDGTEFGRLNWGDVLSVPMGVGCCDFQKPSQNLLDAFEVDPSTKLPLFSSFDDEYIDYTDIENHTMDPRLFHTIAIPGYPYKYLTNKVYNEGWNRNPNTYGYFASLKENVDPDSEYLVHYDAFYGSSKNRIEMRYADVLLFKAEALIELGRSGEALPIINQIRERAGKSTNMIPYATNIGVGLYTDGVNCTWNQDFARQALRWERRLEMALENSRFFDLVRWGIAGETLNAFYNKEKSARIYYSSAHFDEGTEEYCPIPQNQIDFSQGLYTQNKNY
ncbi:MAG: RagB/SusD family nutrient uptake outer membrane protein [Bacteroides xylanisolvens]